MSDTTSSVLNQEVSKPLTFVIATRNRHKAEEIRAILSDRYQYRTLNDFPAAPPVVEDAPTFAGNATKKAVELAQWLSGLRIADCGLRIETKFVLADDSGLEVDALNGAPGVHSARFAASEGSEAASSTNANSPDAANNAKLLRLLENIPIEKRTARFRCVISLVGVNPPTLRSTATEDGLRRTGNPQLFEGVCEGRINFSPRGKGGFGYDPLFVPLGYEQSFAELGEPVKNTISHRARALAKLREWLQTR